MRRRVPSWWLVMSATLLLGIVPLAALHAVAQDPEKILRVAQGWYDFDEDFPLDPQKSLSGSQIAVVGLAYEGLTRLDGDLNTVPAAAESWEFGEDGTVLTFRLRADLVYSDGTPLTAERFRYAIERSCDPHTNSGYAVVLFDIVGCEPLFASLDADAIAAGTPTAAADRAAYEAAKAGLGVRAVDDRTLEVRLTQPAAYIPTVASLWLFAPVKQELVEADPAGWWREPAGLVGNGPFAVTAIDGDEPDQRIAFAANERYLDGRPKLDGIDYLYFPHEEEEPGLDAFRRGEVDILPGPSLAVVEADPALSRDLVRHPAAQTWVWGFNLTKEPFEDKQVREAFAYGFDREAYCREVALPVYGWTCEPTLSWIPAGLPGAIATDAYAFDPAAARQALAESSYGGPEGLPEITYYYYWTEEFDKDQREAEWIAAQYREVLGIELKIEPTTDEEFAALDEAGMLPAQLGFANWFQDYPDPQNWLSVFWTCDSTIYAEPYGYCNPEFDDLVGRADAELDPAKRIALYEEAGRLLVADAPAVFLFNQASIALVSPRVSGAAVTAADLWPGWRSLLVIDLAPAGSATPGAASAVSAARA